MSPHSPEQPSSHDDPWLAVCRAVGREAGIEFRTASDRTRTRLQDHVAAIASASGVRTRVVALRDRWWTQPLEPLVARRAEDGALVALLPASTRRYRLYDPTTHTSRLVTEAVAASLQPFAWCFYRPLPRRALAASDLIRFGLRGSRSDLTAVTAMGIGAGMLGAALPLVTGVLFDTVIPSGDRRQLIMLTLLLMVAAICASMFQTAQAFALQRLEGKMDASLQAAVWDRLLSLPAPFFRGYTTGDLANRGLSITAMREIVTGSVISSVLTGAFSIFSVAVLFYYSWRLALLAVGLTAATVLVAAALGRVQLRYQRETITLSGRLSGTLLQLVNGIAKLRVSGAEQRAFGVWARVFSLKKDMALKARTISNAYVLFTSVAPVVSAAVVFAATARLLDLDNGRALSTGAFIAFNAAFVQLQASALGFGSAVVALLGVVPVYERAKPILTALPEIDSARRDPGPLTGAIEIARVSFRYSANAPLALRDVSMRIPEGGFVAIVGPSGGGKSTLFRLLMGFERPESGAISFDGVDLSLLDVAAVRRQIGVVLQSGRLLADSLFQNIVGAANLTMEEAWRAAAMAGLEQDIQAMPMGMHTLIGEGGVGLSGGQRQRVMIARAIVRKPRILLFDEATSALDNETQAIVAGSLQGLRATRIVIAHRLSTIVRADYIYVLDKGAIVQEGSYADLVRQGGPFGDLARRQSV